jgi:hypothetical protein
MASTAAVKRFFLLWGFVGPWSRNRGERWCVSVNTAAAALATQYQLRG